jgi:hypothetical protein
MIKRLSNKLRVAGLEDNLVKELDLSSASANWLARLGCDIAKRQGLDLLALRGTLQVSLLVNLLQENGYRSLLDTLGKDNPRVAERLQQLSRQPATVTACAA